MRVSSSYLVKKVKTRVCFTLDLTLEFGIPLASTLRLVNCFIDLKQTKDWILSPSIVFVFVPGPPDGRKTAATRFKIRTEYWSVGREMSAGWF